MIEAGTLFVISAPSGAGKTTLVRSVLGQLLQVKLAISYTSRLAKSGEEHGKDYFFISEQEFMTKLRANEFLESAKIFNYYYGTDLKWIMQELAAGIDVILIIDWQGKQQIAARLAQSTLPLVMVSIFILPPDFKILQQRLIARQRESVAEMNLRLATAQQEIAAGKDYDYTIVNDDLADAGKQLCNIIAATRCTTIKHLELYKQLIAGSSELNL